MAYATPQSLLRFGPDALAQLCTTQLAQVLDAELLEAALKDEDLSGYDADEIALVVEAIAWIEGRIDAAARVIDSYIMRSYSLPLTQGQIDGSALPGHAEVIAYHQMMINGPDEVTKNRYDEAMRWLRDVSRGLARIGGAADTEAAVSERRRLTGCMPSAVDWSTYQ